MTSTKADDIPKNQPTITMNTPSCEMSNARLKKRGMMSLQNRSESPMRNAFPDSDHPMIEGSSVFKILNSPSANA